MLIEFITHRLPRQKVLQNYNAFKKQDSDYDNIHYNKYV